MYSLSENTHMVIVDLHIQHVWSFGDVRRGDVELDGIATGAGSTVNVLHSAQINVSLRESLHTQLRSSGSILWKPALPESYS